MTNRKRNENKMNTIPNETENAKLNELFLAVYFNDVEKVIDFKSRYPELYAMKENFQLTWLATMSNEGERIKIENRSFDLTNLTFFNQIIWFDDNWRDDFMPFVERRRQQTTQMLDYWREVDGIQDIKHTIEYNQFWFCFYCKEPEKSNEISGEPLHYYLSKGVREIDLMLYYHAERFNFDETKKLLELGANPDACHDEDFDSNTYYRILLERSFLTHEVIPVFEAFEKNGYNQRFSINNMFDDLLGLCAHEEMYDLLEPYSKNSNQNSTK